MTTPTSPGIVTSISPSGTTAIDTLLGGAKWGAGGAGSGVELDYSLQSGASEWSQDPFTGYGPPGTPQSEAWNPGAPLTSAQIDGIRDAVAAWAEIANIVLVEVTDSASVAGDLRFGTTTETDFAHAYLPGATAYAGDVWFLGGDEVLEDPTPGQYGYLTVLHEIGHALGLKHPHDNDPPFPVAPEAIDSKQFTVMSYRDYIGQPLDSTQSSDFYPTTPMIHDILAIQHLYGANSLTRSGDTNYSWSPGEDIYETIWDGGGSDTIDWSNQSAAALIDLNSGAWSRLGPAHFNGQSPFSETLTIAYGATIESAVGGAGDDTLIGNAAGNLLESGAGNDSLSGGAGVDTLAGGTGNDRYEVSGAGDLLVENPSEGDDTVFASGSFTLADELESLVLTGSAAINATGNSGPNTLIGNAAGNALDGGAGADSMAGSAGNDTYFVDDPGDLILENPLSGTDRVMSPLDWTLGANLEDLTLTGANPASGTGNNLRNAITGNGADNFLSGGGGADTLSGGAGADTLAGGTGDDWLEIDQSGDVPVENAGEGADRVLSPFSYTLGANLEHLTLTGSAVSGTGNGANNSLVGNGADNVLSGLAGDDTLAGLGGADTLSGGAGNDFYDVWTATDVVAESAGEGDDTVSAIVDYALGPEVESLVLAGGAIAGTGNALANVIVGNAAANAILAGEGADSILGNAGNDLLQGQQGSDTLRGGGGNDDLRAGAEGDVVYSGQGDDVVFGKLGDDVLRGGPGNDTLSAGQGNDSLYGGADSDLLQGRAGNDLLTGGAGADRFWFESAAAADADTILDFEAGVDQIALAASIFTALAPGALAAANFREGASAADGDDYVLYDAASGILYYDADASGAAGAAPFAQLAGTPALAAGDFLVA